MIQLRKTLFLLAVAFALAPLARAGGVVGTCDESHLNTALSGGGSVTFSCSGTITLTSTITISANTSIDGTGQTVTISGNNAVRVFVVNSGITFSLNNLTIANGNSTIYGGGGGIYNNGGTVTVTNSIFSGNSASAYEGGGIYNNAGTVTVTNSTFSNNSVPNGGSSSGGGGIYNTGGTVTVTNSTFSGNYDVAYNGGCIYNQSGTSTVTNSTFSGNSASPYTGGVIYNQNGAVTVSYSTFSGNSAYGGGSGIANNGVTVTLISSILADSTGAAECSGTVTDGGYNLADDASCSFTATGSANSVSAASLELGALASNGGPTKTIALGTGSVAIDAIPNGTNGCGTTIITDQRGITRPQGPECDIGAYELIQSVSAKKRRGQLTNE